MDEPPGSWIDVERARLVGLHPAFDPGSCNPAEQSDETMLLSARVDELSVEVAELRGILTRLLRLWTEDE